MENETEYNTLQLPLLMIMQNIQIEQLKRGSYTVQQMEVTGN